MGASEFLPEVNVAPPSAFTRAEVDRRVKAECTGVAALRLEQFVHTFEAALHPLRVRPEDEPIADARCALHRHVAEAAKPNRNISLGERPDSGAIDAVVLARIVDDRLAPKRSEHFDLFVEAFASVIVALTEAFVLDIVPAGPDAESKSFTRQEVEFGGLFRDQRRLSLRQDEHTR